VGAEPQNDSSGMTLANARRPPNGYTGASSLHRFGIEVRTRGHQPECVDSGALWSLCGARVCTCVDQIPVVSSIPRERQQMAERFVAAELGFDLLE
jgi:hypothetical protein